VAESVLLKSDRLRLWLLSLVIVLSGIFIGLPVLNVLIAYAALISLVLFSVRYRYSFLLLVCLMALAGCAFLYGWAVALIFGYLALLPGVAMGYKARTYSTPFSIILWGFLPFLVPLALIIFYYSQIIAIVPSLISDMQALFIENAQIHKDRRFFAQILECALKRVGIKQLLVGETVENEGQVGLSLHQEGFDHRSMVTDDTPHTGNGVVFKRGGKVMVPDQQHQREGS